MNVLALGVFPPPVSGQNIAFEKFCEFLSEAWGVSISRSNLSGGPKRGPKFKVIKTIKTLYALLEIGFKLITFSKTSPEIVYMSQDSGGGRILDVVVITFCRLCRIRLIVHHHSYGYINKSGGFDRLIARMLSTSHHIFLSKKMLADYQSVYGAVNGYVINNSFTLNGDYAILQRTLNSTFTVGLISNLTIEKGVGKFLEIVGSAGVTDWQFLLAGPCSSDELCGQIALAESECNGLTYLGSVAHEEVVSFYSKIDVLIFPSQYENEAQPLVILEAFQRNLPVIAADVGAISDIVPGNMLLNKGAPASEWIDKIKSVYDVWVLANEEQELQSNYTSVLAELCEQNRAEIIKLKEELSNI